MLQTFLQTFDLHTNDQTIFERMSGHTQFVKFGPFNIMNLGNAGFNKKWLGWINEKDQAFKLFRVRSSSSTSDFVLRGQVIFERNLTRVRLFIYPQYSLFLGYGGIGIACHVLSKKIAETHFYSYDWLFGISFVALIGTYSAFNIRDYLQSIRAFKKLIDPKHDELEKRNVRQQ